MVRKQPLHWEQLAVIATLALLTVAAWALTLSQVGSMREVSGPAGGDAPAMDRGSMPAESRPGDMAMGGTVAAEPGVRLVVYIGMWTTMMAAMMLPAAAPMILMFGTVYRAKRQRGGAFVPTWIFVAGYLAVWAAFGACAWTVTDTGEALTRAYPALGGLAPRLAALAMLAAAAYQFTPLKQRCLAHCRSPLSFVMHHWRPGPLGAVRMGMAHGVYCVGCCWVLFVLLVAVGLASVPWMGLITLIVFAEKLFPGGRAVTLTVAGLLAGLGLLALARPDLLARTIG